MHAHKIAGDCPVPRSARAGSRERERLKPRLRACGPSSTFVDDRDTRPRRGTPGAQRPDAPASAGRPKEILDSSADAPALPGNAINCTLVASERPGGSGNLNPQWVAGGSQKADSRSQETAGTANPK